MGLFYTRPTNVGALALPRLTHAYTQPQVNAQEAATNAATDAQQIEAAARPTFSVPRFACAVLFVVALFLAYSWSAHDSEMKAHSDGLYHLFEIMTSGLTILLVGESSSA